MRFYLRIVVTVTIIGMTALIGLEIMLRIFDPWGALAYVQDMKNAYAQLIPDEQLGYVQVDGHRRTPDSAQSSNCTIAIVGDSVTWGVGVSDNETYTNLLALMFPGVQFINAGVVGYNTAQIVTVIQTISADAYLYLMIGNDADNPPDVLAPYKNQTAVEIYYHQFARMQRQGDPTRTFPAWFTGAIQLLNTYDNVTTVFYGSVENPVYQYAAAHLDRIAAMPLWTHNNSVADPHPSAPGHAEIAASLEPVVATLITEFCGAAPPSEVWDE